MHKQPLPRTELRQAILKCMIVSSTSLTLAMSASPSMAENMDTIFTAPPTTCDYIYGVNDALLNDSQILRIDPRHDYQIEPLGPAYDGYDIEALDVSQLGEIYAASGDNTEDVTKAGYLYTVDPNTGILTEIGPTGFAEIDGLSFNPADGTLWGWAQDAGLIKIPLPASIAELVVPYPGEAEDLTWNNDGTVLYVVENLHEDAVAPAVVYTADLVMSSLPEPGDNVPHKLYAYDVLTDSLSEICHNVIGSLGEIEAIEMAEDGSLVLGYHNSNNQPILATINQTTCELTPLADPRYHMTAATPYNDIEALGVCAPCLLDPPSMDWQYAKDSFKDVTGYPALELYGLAIKQEGDTLIVAINAGMGPEGWNVPADLAGPHKVTDGNVGPTDFVMDFDGKKYAVHFSPHSDSGVTELGLYTQPTLIDVTKQNYGHPRLDTYLTIIGDAATMADIPLPNSYFEMNGFRDLPMSIGTATKVENDNYQALTEAELKAKGLNFEAGLNTTTNKLGPFTYGFSFTKPADMVDRFVAYLFTGCSNDGIAIVGELPDCE